jgi:four helix bundle protein
MSQIADELRERTLRYALRILAFCRQLPDAWDVRELGRQLLRAGMGVTGNYWSACRGRSDREFVAKLGVSVDEAEESVLWLTAFIRSGIRKDAETKALLGEGEQLRAILSRSHKTAKENRKRRKKRKNQLANSPTHEFTKST